MKKIIFVLLLALSASATAKDWDSINWNPLPDETYTTKEKVLLASYFVASAVDASQTIYALEGCGGECVGKYKEGNPFFGEYPARNRIIISKLVIGYGIAVAVKNMKPKQRFWGLVGVTLLQSLVVSANYNRPMVGFGIAF